MLTEDQHCNVHLHRFDLHVHHHVHRGSPCPLGAVLQHCQLLRRIHGIIKTRPAINLLENGFIFEGNRNRKMICYLGQRSLALQTSRSFKFQQVSIAWKNKKKGVCFVSHGLSYYVLRYLCKMVWQFAYVGLAASQLPIQQSRPLSVYRVLQQFLR